VGAALVYDAPKFAFRISVNNLTNELYFIPNSPDGLGEVIVIPAPERHYLTSFTFKF
jgi:outer membrane receptor protein involved in Fe transport